MSLRQILFTGILTLFATATTGLAQTEPAKPGDARFGNPTSTARVFQDYIYGVVKKIDKKSNELVLDKTITGVDETVKLDSKTKFIHDGKSSALAALKIGDQVYVNIKKDKKTGALVAKKVLTGVGATELP